MKLNYKIIAVEVGDLLKYDTTINEINRIAEAIFNFEREEFPNENITSSRAKLIYDWIMTLGKQSGLSIDAKNKLLVDFCMKLVSNEQLKEGVISILKENGISDFSLKEQDLNEFNARNFHSEVVKHARKLFLQKNYFHAVFEASKAYNKAVKEKACSNKEGASLMMEVWGCKGVLKITRCETDTDENVQDGVKFLSSGLMRAIRNPTAHEPALDWPIDKQECLEILSLISFLFRQLDKAVYYSGE
ncbi:uncharacterized protein (TIGR02391 family) [Thermosipho japonicus]|uniref:Uncharacterized protein (TIGR02391 family) n=1 Tax=Thermosipho japonicus TaxID=90323 RepID=A0A841GSN0_9BACT|nr:TIGR02391 family protein [Thermosipho japonicus]MBB6062799.1 uncharacterized protein (TIGR02391 family) [Thermosipho japonicus]